MYKDIPDVMLKRHWLVNDPNKIGNDALYGLVRCNPQLALLDIGKVVVQRDHLKREKVKLVTGLCSGHEPCCAGYVGSGMLTASVQGGIQASPSAKLILQTIKELARGHDKGILVIILNNLTTRLNFGLAIERAKNIPNMNIRLLTVNDNCDPRMENRGVTGIVLVIKIAGAMAEANHSVDEIYDFCKDLLNDLGTIAVCLRDTINPNFEVASYINATTKDVEFGPGIHGQAGFSREPLSSCQETINGMFNYLCNNKPGFKLKSNVVVLVNNFGTASNLEQLVVINEVLQYLQSQNITVKRVYTGKMFTSLSLNGFTITILNLINDDIIAYLDAKTDAPYWKTFGQVILEPETNLILSTRFVPKDQSFKPKHGPVVSLTTARIIEHAISFASMALVSCEKRLNIIDSESGDADTGTNLRGAARKITEYINKKKLKIQWPFMLFDELGNLLESTEGLLSCFYAMMFKAAAKSLMNLTEADLLVVEHWIQVFDSVCNAVKRYGRTNYGNNTMYDALYKANIAFKEAISNNMGPLDSMGLAAVAAEEAARRTRLEGALYPDPGAHAVGIWMRAIYETLKVYPEQCQ